MNDEALRGDFLGSVPVRSLQARVEQDARDGASTSKVGSNLARKNPGRTPVTAAGLVVNASKIYLGKNALTEAQVLPVDLFLLSQYIVRKRVPGNGWCYALSLLDHYEREPEKVRQK